ncbi:MAG TPA: glycosyltransferase family 39 protein [Chloroflexia bacterium]|nr:glycosyltransferase family 39 protein [Chloroflexia bacterium]
MTLSGIESKERSNSPGTQKRRWDNLDQGLIIIGLLALLNLILHLIFNGNYSFFRDELSYLEDARRLDWGFVDHPWLTPLIGSLAHLLFGDSVWGLRLFPALATSGVIFLTGLTVRELGGGRFAQGLAALAVLVSPIFLGFGVLFQSAPFEQLLWTGACYFMVKILKRDDPKWWPWVGLLIGLSANNKYSIFFFVFGLGLALLLTPARKYLLTRWFWLGALLGLLILLPNLIWQIQHNFVSFDYTRSINARDVSIGRADGFLPEQFWMITNLFAVPIWLVGLYYFIFKEKRYRALGLQFLIVLAVFIVMRGRSYYLSPAYPVLLAGGAYLWEKWLANRRVIKPLWLSALALTGLLFVPATLPVFPVGSDGFKSASGVNDTFKEMVGWEELVAETANIYRGLSPQEQANTAILANNYGEAGAIDLYGPAYGLPQAISPVNSYYYWSQNRLKATTYIVLGSRPEDATELSASCGKLEQIVPRFANRYNVKNEESHYSIYLCRNPKISLEQAWPSLKRYG